MSQVADRTRFHYVTWLMALLCTFLSPVASNANITETAYYRTALKAYRDDVAQFQAISLSAISSIRVGALSDGVLPSADAAGQNHQLCPRCAGIPGAPQTHRPEEQRAQHRMGLRHYLGVRRRRFTGATAGLQSRPLGGRAITAATRPSARTPAWRTAALHRPTARPATTSCGAGSSKLAGGVV